MKAYQNSQSGFSIVEMMIAIGLGILLLMGVLQIFDANRVSSRLQHAFAEVQEAGRIAAELLARDIRMADYWGCAPDISDVTDHLDETDAEYKDYMKIIGQDGISGEDNVTSKTFGAGTIKVKDGTDVLTMKGSSNVSGAKVTPPYMNQNSARIHLKDGIVIPKGTILMISDCTGGDIFSNTMDTQANNGRLGHSTGNNTGVDNKVKDLSRVYNGNAQITMPYQRSYFIGENPDSGWSLYREDNGTVEELVRNIDDLQFVYGEDTTGNGSADTFGVATAVNMDNVVSIKATFNAFSSDAVFDGAALNRAYNITANIRNRTL